MKHKKMKQKRHKLAKERKNVSGEPVELIAKRYFMYLERFQAVGFLNPLQIRLIAETFAHIPTSYFFDENRNDWWNYYQMDEHFNFIKDVRIGISNLKVMDAIRRHNVPVTEIAIKNFFQADPNSTSPDDATPNKFFYKKEYDKGVTVGPIIILQEFNRYNRVIDGNHRVSDAILNSKESISAYIISDDFLLENDCFHLDYDKQLFEAHQLFHSSYIKKYEV